MKKTLVLIVLTSLALTGWCDNNAYIKLNDKNNKHPRIESVTFPGNADTREMYNSIYGHGAVIENPWVAFRVYMDNRQSLDLYVKQSPQLELDVTGFYTTPQQLEEGYGCDVLWAGQSIGAGSFRGYQGQPVTIDTVASRTQRVLSNSSVEVADKDWIFNGHPIQMSQRYSMLPDSRDLTVEIQLEGYQPDDLFATGIQKLETDNIGFIQPDGLAASWGSNVPDKKHPELIEQVGLAIEVNQDNIVEAKEDDLNYLFILKPDKDGKITYKIISCGDREKDGFKDAESWLSYIKSNYQKNNNK
ncbi:MAG: DUF4861 family protein [Muribaculaceae bacterium]|nr:DUF4861 family protein [Muribaculaceae bacterium]